MFKRLFVHYSLLIIVYFRGLVFVERKKQIQLINFYEYFIRAEPCQLFMFIVMTS